MMSGFLNVAKEEFRLFRRFPKLFLSAFAISLVPALYLLIYISSVWDPAAHTADLKVAIVNQDKGFSHAGKTVNVGADLEKKLMDGKTFGFFVQTDPDKVRTEVEKGDIAFAIIIPSDFSEKAVPGIVAGGAKVQTIISEGNNYSAAAFGRRFSAELGHQVNETLNRNRWDLVLETVSSARDKLARLNAGVAELRQGAARLNEGTATYAQAAATVSDGFVQVGDAIRQMNEKFPEQQDLNQLVAGTDALARGQASLGAGLKKLRTGADKLTAGAELMQEKSKDIPFAGKKVADGAGQLAKGGSQIETGLNTAVKGSQKLASGAKKVNEGTAKLVDGLGQLGAGIGTLSDKIPDAEKLADFKAGGTSLLDGTTQLLAGIDRMVAEIPKDIPAVDGSAAGLADSVHTELEIVNPVANNGTALVPNMASVALWVGAVMIAYMFQFRMMLETNQSVGRIAKGLGKITGASVVAIIQASLAYAMLSAGLGVVAPSPVLFWLTLVLASLTFLFVIYAMLRLFGEAGKLLAVLFLTLQLSAGGGIAPIELAGPFYQMVNPLLPFTWVVKALRTALFGAFGNDLGTDLQMLAIFGVLALGIAIVVGRWRHVRLEFFRPGVEL